MARGSTTPPSSQSNKLLSKMEGADEYQSVSKFRFLNLPGEIRNMIYDLAAEETKLSWPELPELSRKRRRNTTKRATSDFPFWGLTRSCTQIREEFMGQWMESHQITLSQLEQYIPVFFPQPSKKNGHRLAGHANRSGCLKVMVRIGDFHGDLDILPLVKLKGRLPDYTIQFQQHGSDVPTHHMTGLDLIVNNRNSEWLSLIGGRKLSQIRIWECVNNLTGKDICKLVLIVNERWAEAWMKFYIYDDEEECQEFMSAIGLHQTEDCTFAAGVCY